MAMAAHVLVVDDEANLRRNLACYLEDEGMEVLQAGSVCEALEKVRNTSDLDVCIMDMRLPDMDGNAAILALHDAYPGLLFLIHTGTAGYTLPEELRRLGLTSDHVFLKPMTDMAPLASAVVRLTETERYT